MNKINYDGPFISYSDQCPHQYMSIEDNVFYCQKEKGHNGPHEYKIEWGDKFHYCPENKKCEFIDLDKKELRCKNLKFDEHKRLDECWWSCLKAEEIEKYNQLKGEI